MLHSNPLEGYFKKFPERRPRSNISSSALERGYVATFEMADKVPLLVDIEIQLPELDRQTSEIKWKSVRDEVFPNGKKQKVDCFAGLLVLPHGKLVDYVHMGYGSTYENYILLEIAAGDFRRAKEFNYQ